MTGQSLISGNVAARLIAVSMLALVAACSSPEQKLENYSADAAEYFDNGEYAKAYIQYQNALKINEEHIPSLLGLAEIAEKRQDFQAMFGFLQRVVRLDPTQIDAHIKLGKIYLIGSDEKSALDEAEKALALDANSIDAKALKAGVLLKLGNNAGAVELAKEVLEEDPGNAEAVTVVATDLSAGGDNIAALAELDRGLEINPKMAMLQLLRIQLLKNLNRPEDAVAAYAHLIELFPEEVAYRRVYSTELVRRRDFEGAREQLEAIAELAPENLDAKLNVVRVIKASGDEAGAEARLQEFIAADPDNIQLKFALSDYYLGDGDPEKSRAMLDRLAASDDQDVAFRAKNKIAGILLTANKTEEAQELIDEILAADERNTEALMKRAAIQIDAEEFDQAIVNLRTAIDNSPDNSDAMVLMAAAFERQNNFSFAQAEYAKAFEASRRASSIANRFARFLIRRENLNRAEEVLVDSLAAHPGNVDNLRLLASIRLSRQDWRGAEEVGQLLANLGDQGDLAANVKTAAYVGLEDFESVIDTLNSRRAEAPLNSRPLAALIAAYLKEDRKDEARTLLDDILQSDPGNYAAHILRARLYASEGDNDNAEAQLIAATESNPDKAEAFELLYRGYLRQDRIDDATALIDRGLEAAPESVALRVFKADVYLNQGEFEKALEIYSQIVKERPDDLIVANNFVSLSSDLRLDDASITRALSIAKTLENQNFPYYQDTVGWAYYRAGEYATAITYLQKALEKAPDNAEMLYHLGAAQAANGDSNSAKENLNKALEKGGDDFRFEKEVRALLDGQ